MSRLTDFFRKYIPCLNKYVLVIIIFTVFTFLVGDSNLYNCYKYNEKIRILEKEIQRYTLEIENNKKKIKEIQTDKVGLEQFAREEYLMKKENEDLFIIEE